MKAVVICTQRSEITKTLLGDSLDCMLPLVDRPMIQHVIEYLVSHGVTTIDVVCDQKADSLRSLLDNGQRWGVELQFLPAEEAPSPFLALQHRCWDDDLVLLASGVNLPCISVDEPLTGGQRCWVLPDGEWSGWSLLDNETLEASLGSGSSADVEGFLRAINGVAWSETETIGVSYMKQLLDSQQRILEGEFAPVFVNGREGRTPGIRLCRNAKTHGSVELETPVFLGDNARVGKGAVLGPNTVVGDDCIIDRNVTLENSLVLPGTYVGEWLEAHDCILGPRGFVNVRLGASVHVDDSLLLCST